MIAPNFMDEIDCGSFFDHIDDLLDFPAEDVDAAALPATAANSNSFPTIYSDSVFSANSASDLSAELSVPYEDIVQLEWLSNFVEDSFSGGSLTMKKLEPSSCATNNNNNDSATHSQFQTSSPVSVLESSSSCSGGEKPVAPLPRSSPPEMVVPVPCGGRARSKRPRPATFKPRPAMHLVSPASSVGENTQRNSDSDNFAESHPVIKIAKQASGEHKKKKKIKVSCPSGAASGDDTNQQTVSAAQAVRKCMHCEITKTPQWRAGPMGPKTLCNACGVRYKSGRLFPEYRPAASPTFCPSVHSNSHKKVLEMRNKTPPHSAASPELIPNTNTSLPLEDGMGGGGNA
ncbi:GATA transcription factor 8-like [Senna tora]|uniref:GATA transcription factor n=1 Tax=Senna tora TaxID=362788 RepID=A0A834TMK2_9FABA|nr:GATA transcription factor 8-like [Senna tora]